MSGRTACFEGEICLIRSDSSAENSFSSSLRRDQFLTTLCLEFVEQINVGAAKGWVQYLKEKDLTDELSSVGEDGWLKLSVKITIVSDEAFTNALPPILRQHPTHLLPKIDSGTEVRHQGTDRFSRTVITLDLLIAQGIGQIDEIDHCYRLTTNKWFARYEVRYSRSPSDCSGSLCSNSCLCIDPFWNRRQDRSLQMRSRWKAYYGAEKTFFRSSDDLVCSRCIGMKRDEDGYLSAFFVSKNEYRVEVQFGFELVNCANGDHSKRTGKRGGFRTVFEVDRCLIGTLHEFSCIDDCRKARLLPCSTITSPNNGFVRDDHFLVLLDLRVKRKDNELSKVIVDGKTAICQVSYCFVALSHMKLESSGSRDSCMI